jgi:divalent metal cation (Fe/Co/Zn/Cd) transporter
MDGIEPDLLDSAEHAIGHVEGVTGIDDVRLRWVGHRVHGSVIVRVEDAPFHEIEAIVARVQEEIREHIPHADLLHVSATTGARGAETPVP